FLSGFIRPMSRRITGPIFLPIGRSCEPAGNSGIWWEPCWFLPPCARRFSRVGFSRFANPWAWRPVIRMFEGLCDVGYGTAIRRAGAARPLRNEARVVAQPDLLESGKCRHVG